MTKHNKYYYEKDRNMKTTTDKWHEKGCLSSKGKHKSITLSKMPISKEDLVRGHMHCGNPTIEQILETRDANYGNWDMQAEMSQQMKNVLRIAGTWKDLSDAQRESIDMILHKISRIVNGNPNYKDSWTDIIGYAKLIEKEL